MRSILALCIIVAMAAASAWSAESYRVGSLEITAPWTRATPKGATIAGGYAQIRNSGTVADRLVGGSLDAAERFELHSMATDQGVMRMREIKQGLEIKPGGSVELKPGAYHAMFIGLKRPLVPGERIKGTLVFEQAGRVDIEFAVQAIGSQSGSHGHSGAHR